MSRQSSSTTPVEGAPAAKTPLWKRPLAVFGRLLSWARAHRLQALLLAGASLVVVAGLVVTVVVVVRLWSHKSTTVQLRDSDLALAALDEGDDAAVRKLCDAISAKKPPVPEELAVVAYIRGVFDAREANAELGASQVKLALLAAKQLQEAKAAGFPRGREASGAYLLAKNVYRSGQLSASRPLLVEALKLNPGQQAELNYLLAAVDQFEDHPAEALAENARVLADADASSELQLRGQVQRGHLLLALGRVDEALQPLEKIPATAQPSADVLLLRGEIALEQTRAARKAQPAPEAAKIAQQYQDVIKTLRQAQSADTITSGVTRRAMYLVGLCFLESGDDQAAQGQFARTRKLFPDTQEALAAAFEEAELWRKADKKGEALEGYLSVLKAIPPGDAYRNPLLSGDVLRARVGAAFQQYREAHEDTACLALADRLAPLFPRERGVELAAEVLQDWGHRLFAEADRLPYSRAEPLRKQGRKQMRGAGQRFAELAGLLGTDPRVPEAWWSAAEADLEGHDFHAASAALPQYLLVESRRRHAEALTALGESLMAEGRLEEAMQTLGKCIEFHPRDAAAFRARLAASRACAEKGDAAKAEALLQENLNADLLTPASSEWRESLFDLGRLLHSMGRYADALPKLEQAVDRYPDSPRALESRYLAADSLHRIADTTQLSLREVLVENTRILRVKQIQQALEAALGHYRVVRDQLAERQENTELPPAERALLRNSYLAVGDVCYSLGRYDDAIQAYLTAVNRCANSPAALEGYTQLAHAYERLNRPNDARNVLEQAKLLLKRLKPDQSFTDSTIRTPQQWRDLLENLTKST